MNIIKRIQFMHRAMCYKIRNKVRCSLDTKIGKNVEFEGDNFLGQRVLVNHVELGYGSYIGDNSEICYCKIGRFCSISSDVKVIIGSHPSEIFVSTHPAFFSVNNSNVLSYVNKQKCEEYRNVPNSKFAIVIGNDVWIGTNVRIMEGVTIGDGAIIAAGAVVTKNVQPYSIVGGVPAKVLKYRFEEKIIIELLKIKWWNRDLTWIKENAELFENASVFIEKINRE